MLALVQDSKSKIAAEATLKRNLKAALTRQGTRTIGFRGGSVDETIYSAGEGQLWVAFGGPLEDGAVQRYWNAFGIFEPDRPAQTITVEINIAIDSNAGWVAGFFAEDRDTGHTFLMHSGKFGGGRPGIGKSAFLVWSRKKLVDVTKKDGGIQSGIAVGKLNDPDLTGRIRTFVKNVQSFKDQAAAGVLDTPEFKRQVEEFDKYSKEFSGKKQGVRGGTFKYVTYHGDIVQKLYDERTARLAPGEKVFNSTLIDLFVNKDGVLSEVYEVKTGVGRQMLYTAIGQAVTHATTGGEGVAKFLVVPADEDIPEDFEQAIAVPGVQVRRFRLDGTGRNRVIKLD
ncbi:MAG: hypothetical protein M0002_00965 [Rhodospirillales bacterium]|nr:hypothetical protein [Rhodospirillales bacterium]